MSDDDDNEFQEAAEEDFPEDGFPMAGFRRAKIALISEWIDDLIFEEDVPVREAKIDLIQAGLRDLWRTDRMALDRLREGCLEEHQRLIAAETRRAVEAELARDDLRVELMAETKRADAAERERDDLHRRR